MVHQRPSSPFVGELEGGQFPAILICWSRPCNAAIPDLIRCDRELVHIQCLHDSTMSAMLVPVIIISYIERSEQYKQQCHALGMPSGCH